VIGQVATLFYFAYFFVIIPLIAKYEKPRPLPESISTPVLKERS
jgi:quinol-cytochrome oxidoreductase complex cytochrome b subunit